MDTFSQDMIRVALVGAGATAVMDGWLMLLRRAGIPTLNFAMLGRWTGHAMGGRLMHVAIAKSPPIPGELALGWAAHYATGIVFAAALALLVGASWMQSPTFAPALAFGLATVAVPLFLLQPALGSGVAFSNSPAPAMNCLRSVVNHAVFGSGLYLAALTLERSFS